MLLSEFGGMNVKQALGGQMPEMDFQTRPGIKIGQEAYYMQIYYFSRTGRSKKIAEELAGRFGVTARMIDDNREWGGKINYVKAGAMPPGVKTFTEEVGRENITAVVTSLGSTLKNRDGFKNVIDLVGKEISAPEEL